MTAPEEAFIAVDVEAAGPYPERYSLLAIGACLVEDPAQGFYIELKPLKREADQLALQVTRLSMDKLAVHGTEPDRAMRLMAGWIRRVVPAGRQPVMVSYNAPFDWPFINHYFIEYVGENPLGHSAIDIKAFYMGLIGCAWEETSMFYLSPRFLKGRKSPGDALADARRQAELFRQLLAQARGAPPEPST
jgi:DNA polymerase III alpha subunit (gram-positive type)